MSALELRGYRYLNSTGGDLLHGLGCDEDVRATYGRALRSVRDAERRLLERRLAAV